MDAQNPGFLQFYFRGSSALVLHMHCDCFKKFKDLIFVDKLSARKAKTSSLETLSVYDNHIARPTLLQEGMS